MSSVRTWVNIAPEAKANLINMSAATELSDALRLIAQAKLAAGLGEWAWADVVTNRLIGLYETAPLNEDERSQIETTLAMSSRLDELASLIRKRDSLTVDLSIVVEDGDDQATPTSSWARFAPDRACTLMWNAKTFASSQSEVFIRRLLFTLPLIFAYANSDSFQSGRCRIDISDHGSPGQISFSGSDPRYLVPDGVFLHERGYEKLRSHFRLCNPPWQTRKPCVFWRGTTTGWASSWRDLPRVKLCRWAAISSEKERLDVALSEVVQRSAEEVFEINAAGLIGNYVPATELANYQCHIDIDGNTNSWPGLFSKLLSGSPIIKVASEHGHRQWYYDRLVPWKNFVPARADLSDLDERVRWIFANSEAAEKIGRNGALLADELSYEGEIRRSAAAFGRAVLDQGLQC